MPAIVLGDFNEDLLSAPSSSELLRLMSSKGFTQLITVPATDSGTLLDHNATTTTVVYVVDTILIMMPHTFLYLCKIDA